MRHGAHPAYPIGWSAKRNPAEEGLTRMSRPPIRRVALLTAGGYAPCLSSAVGGLIQRYSEVLPDVEIIGYKHGYHGVLAGNYVVIDQ